MTVSKGNEYLRQIVPLEVAPMNGLTREVRLERWIDMPARGWYSADDHIHLRRSPADDAAIVRWIAAEDIHVGPQQRRVSKRTIILVRDHDDRERRLGTQEPCVRGMLIECALDRFDRLFEAASRSAERCNCCEGRRERASVIRRARTIGVARVADERAAYERGAVRLQRCVLANARA